jgi:hypothetical protein
VNAPPSTNSGRAPPGAPAAEVGRSPAWIAAPAALRAELKVLDWVWLEDWGRAGGEAPRARAAPAPKGAPR